MNLHQFNAITQKIPETIRAVYPLENLVFMDIETTGFSARYNQIICLGLLFYSSTWHLKQLWASNAIEERELLQQLLQFDQNNTLYICYNGKSFDMPFIVKRMAYHKLTAPPLHNRILDFVSLGRLYATHNKLDSYSFKTLENHFNLGRVQDVFGEEIVATFTAYLNSSDPCLKDAILKHNALDVINMPPLLWALSEHAPQKLKQLLPLILQIEPCSLTFVSSIEKGYLVIRGTVIPPVKISTHFIAGLEIELTHTALKIKIPVVTQQMENHYFIRVDLDQCALSTVPYRALDHQEQVKWVIDIDGHLQTIAIRQVVHFILQKHADLNNSV